MVGLGPGDLDWITPQTRRELARATDLIGYFPYLDRVGVRTGQTRHPSDNTDEPARARLACELAQQGKAVVVVSSGDPRCLRHGHRRLGRGQGVAGRAGTGDPGNDCGAGGGQPGRRPPLGHDYAVISLSDRLKPWDIIAKRVSAAAAADMAIAVYNPASKTRTWQVGAMKELLLAHRDPATPGRHRPGCRRSARTGAGGDPG